MLDRELQGRYFGHDVNNETIKTTTASMVEPGTASERAIERIEQSETADIVIGLVDQNAAENVPTIAGTIRTGLASLSQTARTLVVFRKAGTGSNQPESLEALADEALHLGTFSLPEIHPSVTAAEGISNAYRSIWSISERLGARACVVIASSVETVTPTWIHGLVQPLLERDIDLVAPCYVPHKFEGLLNRAILHPLIRALYGKQIQNPFGPDFGFSARLFPGLLQIDPARTRYEGAQQLALVGPHAIARGFRVCQAYLGKRTYPPVDWKNVDSILAEILGPLFLGVERDAPFWQHIRNSEPVPTYGEPPPWTEETVVVDTQRLLEPFRLGFRNLQEIWGLVLPPTVLLELQKADRLPSEQFRIPDELWARIVYDFALAHRLRIIARDHLLRAMTPLYLGWITSYALEVKAAGGIGVQRRVDRLSTAFENEKPYLVSRWRWPDRFNP
jgi:hypothetical protein